MEIPLFSLNYEMFTQRGNRKCDTLVRNITKKILNSKRYISKEQVEMWIKQGMDKISQKDGEVYDTEPRQYIIGNVEKVYQSKYGNDKYLNFYL